MRSRVQKCHRAIPLPRSFPQDVFVIDDSSSSASSFASLLADDGSAFPSESERRAMIDPASHVAFIPFSSGATGKPKGVEVTHRNIVGNVFQVRRDRGKLPFCLEISRAFISLPISLVLRPSRFRRTERGWFGGSESRTSPYVAYLHVDQLAK